MFGYIKISEDELLVRDWKKYKSAYCALCRNIGCYSLTARMMLSYDMVFCVLLAGIKIHEEDRKCHRKFRHCKKECGDEKLKYMAAVSVILQYYKLKDDVIDGKRSRRYLVKAIKRGYSKAKKDFPEIESRIASAMTQLIKLENDQCTDWETLDMCFSNILYDIIDCSPGKDEYTEVRGRLARHVAAWVYWFDMVQDLEEDRKEENYNAILLHGDEKKAIKHIQEMLLQHIANAEVLCDLLPYTDETPIIRNIVTVGLPKQMSIIGLSLSAS